jgi:hypothetical protein
MATVLTHACVPTAPVCRRAARGSVPQYEDVESGKTQWENPLDARCREWYRNELHISEAERSIASLEETIEDLNSSARRRTHQLAKQAQGVSAEVSTLRASLATRQATLRELQTKVNSLEEQLSSRARLTPPAAHTSAMRHKPAGYRPGADEPAKLAPAEAVHGSSRRTRASSRRSTYAADTAATSRALAAIAGPHDVSGIGAQSRAHGGQIGTSASAGGLSLPVIDPRSRGA